MSTVTLKPNTSTRDESRWPHRIAVLLCCVTFPLIWVGGMVTTTDAGMAVADWPTTFGYNMFAYPIETWVYGAYDVFIEHGHRLFAAFVGMLTIALVVVFYRRESRMWVRGLGLAALALVILQGILGGMRVVLDERRLAMIHGCVGPAFFALTVALAVVTSRLWKDGRAVRRHSRSGMLQRFALLTTVFAYLQLVAGAQLRHISPAASANSFRTTVFVHLFLAGVLMIHILLVAGIVLTSGLGASGLTRPAIALCLLIAVQLVLGGATWIVNYGWPSFVGESPSTAGFTIEAKGIMQSNVVTAHVATGSLILAVALQLTLRSLRALRPLAAEARSEPMLKGAAV